MIRIPAAVALLAVLALTACAPGTPVPSDSPSTGASDTATPEPPAAAVDRPAPIFDAACATLVPDALVAPILPFAYAGHEVTATEYAAHPSIPRHGAVAQVGGLLCEWSNGEGYSSQTGSSAFRGLQLAVLPDGASGWEHYAGYYGVTGDEFVDCFAESSTCTLETVAAGYWFSAEILTTVGPGTEDAVRALAAHLRAAAAGFGTPRERWYPVDLRTIPDDCEVVLPAPLVAEVFGSSDALYPSAGEQGGWSLWAEAWSRNGGYGCGWYGETEQFSVSSQPGGAWLAQQLGVTANGVDVDIPGLGADGVARLTTYADGSSQVDLVAHGTWVTTVVAGSPDPDAGVRALATHVAGLFAP